MIRIITLDEMRSLIQKVHLKTFFLKLIDQLEQDFGRWEEFEKSPRHAIYYPQGVIELMPISDRKYYSFKYVNGHPGNPQHGKQTVIALGLLSETASGYPLLISEMTLLTALRTAATAALVSKYMARKNVSSFGIVGTGAQSEFQVLAHYFALGIKDVYYFDLDPHAMQKFEHNLGSFGIKLHRCKSAEAVAQQSAIVTTATAAPGRAKIIQSSWIKPGVHINGIGGDSPGKTELDPLLLDKAKIVVEYLPQTKEEGEIQGSSTSRVYAELWELVQKRKAGRESVQEITLFDSVGFALEDYSALRLVYALAEEHQIGHLHTMVPEISDPKNLFSLLI